MTEELVSSSNRSVTVLAPMLLVLFGICPETPGLCKVLFQISSAFEKLAAGLVAAEVVWLLVVGEPVRHLACRESCVVRRLGLLKSKRLLCVNTCDRRSYQLLCRGL